MFRLFLDGVQVAYAPQDERRLVWTTQKPHERIEVRGHAADAVLRWNDRVLHRGPLVGECIRTIYMISGTPAAIHVQPGDRIEVTWR